jgi:hypothetical protein
MAEILDYIARRIRREFPDGVQVVPESTPVVSFGNVRTARVATLGLNPSKKDFFDDDRTELVGDKRRLETLKSLGVTNLVGASDEVAWRVFEGCNGYFHRRPYMRWFGPLEKVLKHVNTSYFDGSGCHLDLVQWATNPVWGKLAASIRNSLLDADVPFLKRQLEQENIRLLLLNGTSIVKAYEDRLDGKLEEIPLEHKGRVRFFTGLYADRICVAGWNINLQGAFGVTKEEINSIGEAVARIEREKCP